MIKRRNSVELLRFLFTLVILMLHSHGLRVENPRQYPFVGGYLGVEFFLILSGYFLTSELFERSTHTHLRATAYVRKQYKKLLPMIVLSVGIFYIVYYLNGTLTASDLPYMVYEILCLPQSGIYKTFLNLPLWYVSAYLICLPVFLFLLEWQRSFFYEIGSVFLPLLVYGFLCRKNIYLDIWSFDSGIWFVGLLRAFSGLCMGVCCFRLSACFKKLKWREEVRNYLPAVVFLLFSVVIGFMAVLGFTYADYFLVFLMTFALALLFSCDAVLGNGSKWAAFLGKWGVAIYCSHWLIRDVVPKLFPENGYFELLPSYLLFSLLYGLLILWLSGVLSRGMAKMKKKVLYDTEI